MLLCSLFGQVKLVADLSDDSKEARCIVENRHSRSDSYIV